MVSKIHYDARRRHWWVKWFDGRAWRKKVVGRPPKTWKGKGEPTPTPEAYDAAGALAEAEKAARSLSDPVANHDLAAFLGAYLERYKLRSAEGSAAKLAQHIAAFLAYCEPRRIATAGQVTRAACADYLAHRAAIGKARNTIKGEMGLLSGAWAEAVKADRVAANPWAKQEVPVKATRKRRGSWTPEQFALLTEAARPWLRDILVLGTQTGLRITALVSITWREIEWAKEGEKGFGQLRVPEALSKSGKGYTVPLSAKAHDLLQRLYTTRGDDGGPILRGSKGGPTTGAVTAGAILATCARAGLPKPDSPNHHTRRTFGRWAVHGQDTWAGRPVPVYVVSKWLGHSSVEMTESYLQLDKDSSVDWMVGE